MPTMCGGSPPTARKTSTRAVADGQVASSQKKSTVKRTLVRRKRADRLQHVGGAGKDDFFQHRCVCHRTIERGYALDRRVEVLEQFFGNARGDLRTETARQLVF